MLGVSLTSADDRVRRTSRVSQAVFGMFFAMFTLQTGVPAFQREGGLPTVRRRGRRDENILEVDRWSERDTRAGRYLYAPFARSGHRARRPPLKIQIAGEDDERAWKGPTGIKSLSTRSLRRIPRTRRVNGSGRSFTPRSSMRSTASNSATPRFSFGRRLRMPRRVEPLSIAAATWPGRSVPVPTSGARCQLYGFARGVERRLRGPRPLAETCGQVHESYRARPRLGEPKSRRPCSSGARPTDSARVILHSPVGTPLASGGRHRRRLAR